jgi:hypothetical protein
MSNVFLKIFQKLLRITSFICDSAEAQAHMETQRVLGCDTKLVKGGHRRNLSEVPRGCGSIGGRCHRFCAHILAEIVEKGVEIGVFKGDIIAFRHTMVEQVESCLMFRYTHYFLL